MRFDIIDVICAYILSRMYVNVDAGDGSFQILSNILRDWEWKFKIYNANLIRFYILNAVNFFISDRTQIFNENNYCGIRV